MRSIALDKPVLVASVLLLAAAPPRGAIVREPLLGLRWPMPRAGFAAADPALKRRCANLVNANYDAELYVLARDATPRGELLIVSGRSIPRRADLPAVTDDLGAVLRWQGGRCTMIGPALEPFGDPDDYAAAVSSAELAALADDAARRYVAGSGGAPALCATTRRQRVRFARVPAVLARAFRRAAPCLRQG